jgi:hypothetical protein
MLQAVFRARMRSRDRPLAARLGWIQFSGLSVAGYPVGESAFSRPYSEVERQRLLVSHSSRSPCR